MKKILLLFALTIFILSSCSTAYYFKKSKYDLVIEKTVKKLRKKPNKEKQIDFLEKSYTIVNRKDKDRIAFLKQENQAISWDEIYHIYSRLKWRQEKVKEIIPLTYSGGVLNFELFDYDQEVIDAKKNAAEYYYTHGQELLNSGGKLNARKAYSEFLQVRTYYPNYENIDNFIATAREKGMTHIFVYPENNSFIELPNAVLMEIMPISFHKLNSDWIEYHSETMNEYPDNEIIVSINKIDISSGMINEREFTETKEISSWKYILDEDGNVMKDSLGNDMKEKVIEEISCQVFETTQRKEIVFEVSLKYIDVFTGKEIKEFPFFANSFFENRYATAHGDLNALSDETLSILGNKPVPLPDDFTMIDSGIPVLRDAVYEALKKNKMVLD